MIPRHLLIAVGAMGVAVLLMSIYVWQVRSRVAEIQSATADTRPVAPPVAGPTEQVTLYVAYDDAGVLRARTARIPLPAGRQQRAEELLRALLNIYLYKSTPHRLAPGSELRDVYLVDPGLTIIDVNAEELTLASFIQSLRVNMPGITRVKILVDGKPRETLAGHADLADFYDVSSVTKMAEQMQTSQ